jgi:hypothetical protein
MNKLLSMIVAAMFAAASASAFAASHTGAPMKDEKKASTKKEAPKEPTAKQKAQQERMKACNEQASDKKLKGDDRKKFMSSCLKPAAKKASDMKAKDKK